MINSDLESGFFGAILTQIHVYFVIYNIRTVKKMSFQKGNFEQIIDEIAENSGFCRTVKWASN